MREFTLSRNECPIHPAFLTNIKITDFTPDGDDCEYDEYAIESSRSLKWGPRSFTDNDGNLYDLSLIGTSFKEADNAPCKYVASFVDNGNKPFVGMTMHPLPQAWWHPITDKPITGIAYERNIIDIEGYPYELIFNSDWEWKTRLFNRLTLQVKATGQSVIRFEGENFDGCVIEHDFEVEPEQADRFMFKLTRLLGDGGAREAFETPFDMSNINLHFKDGSSINYGCICKYGETSTDCIVSDFLSGLAPTLPKTISNAIAQLPKCGF